MKCDKYGDALIDGADTGGKLECGLAKHLEMCNQCRTRLQQEQSLFEAIDGSLRFQANEIAQAGFLAGVHGNDSSLADVLIIARLPQRAPGPLPEGFEPDSGVETTPTSYATQPRTSELVFR